MPRAGGSSSRPSSSHRSSGSRSTGHRSSSSSNNHRPSSSGSSRSSVSHSSGGFGSSNRHSGYNTPPHSYNSPPPPPGPGYHSPPPTPRPSRRTYINVFNGGRRRYDDSYYVPPTGGVPSGRGRRIGNIITAIIVVFILFIIIGMISSRGSKTSAIQKPGNYVQENQHSDFEKPKVDKKRKLDKSLCIETDYYSNKTDELGYFNSTVEEGLKYFYEKTGVQPYVMTVDIDEVDYWDDDKAISQYEELFDDEGHFLLIIFGDKEGSVDWEYSWVIGFDAESVMDNQSLDMLWYYIDTYYQSDKSDSKLISDAFKDTAKAIMK